MNQHLIIGPPGTGKTTRLLNVMDRELGDGVRPDRIAFLSFTRKATDEARERAMEKFGFDKQDLPWFRTIHSLAFSRLGLRRDEVMQPKHYRELGAALGLTFQTRADVEEGLPSGRFTGDRYVFIDGFSRARDIEPETAYRLCSGEGEEELNWFEFKRFRHTLKEYKEQRGLVDFTDMLELDQAPLELDVVIVDEAQDLSTLQWMYLGRVVLPYAKRIYVAGDDDQAIFQWSGADVECFQTLEGTVETLSQSHRVPVSVHRVAERIAGGIRHRYAKKYLPKAEPGTVTHHMEPDAVDLVDAGTWLLLGRNIHMLTPLVAMVRAQGLPYSLRGESAINSKHVRAIQVFERWRKGHEPHPDDRDLVAGYLRRGDQPWPREIWHDALVRIPLEDREWYTGILRRGESLTKTPRINISTIHGVKGGEADSVLLMTDMSARTWSAYQVEPDAEHRVWYVGATRTKKNLHIIQPQTRMGYDNY
jgi:DNA helicase-2/ATP-dependent DNA helicase PcrA